ncbi:TPA: hypothetical protein ACGU7D_004261 [Vibrio vulnificus]
MATTIQIAENLRLGKYIEIAGRHCEIEEVSFTQALTRKKSLEELMEVMSSALISRGIIKEERGSYYWIENGEPLIPEEDFED